MQDGCINSKGKLEGRSLSQNSKNAGKICRQLGVTPKHTQKISYNSILFLIMVGKLEM